MPTRCLPGQEATNKLGSMAANARKDAGTAGIAPFPFVEIAAFMPSWAALKVEAEEAEGTRLWHLDLRIPELRVRGGGCGGGSRFRENPTPPIRRI